MKRTIIYVSAVAAAVLALVSCSKEALGGKENKPVKENGRVITVSFAGVKTSLGENATPVFEKNDQIILSDGQTTETVGVSVNNDGVATITTTLTGTLTAVYPAAASTDGKTFTVRSGQDGTFASANICTATIPDGANPSAVFANQTAVLKFDLNHTGATSLGIKGAGITDETDKTDTIGVSTIPADGICYVAVKSDPNAKDITFRHGEVWKTVNTALARNALYKVAKNDWNYPYVEIKMTVGGVTKTYKWATINVGADKVGDPGEYFMWGETVGQKPSGKAFTFPDSKYYSADNSTWDSSKGFGCENCPYTNGVYNNDSNKKVFTKYVPTDKADGYWNGEGTSDNKPVLDLCDDAANANWGDSWRMPTKEEYAALLTATGTTDSNYSGGVLTIKGHSDLIFTAAGYGNGTGLSSVGSGYYWSSSLTTVNPLNAWLFYFDISDVLTYQFNRYGGRSVRAISD